MKNFADFLQEAVESASALQDVDNSWTEQLKGGKSILCWTGDSPAELKMYMSKKDIFSTRFITKYTEIGGKPSFVSSSDTFKFAIPVSMEEIKKHIVE